MEQVNCSGISCIPAAGQKNKTRSRRVAALLFSVLAIIFCLFYIGPQLEKLPLFEPVARFIDERGIEANVYFYTEVEEFSEAHINMDNSMDYPPQWPQSVKPNEL
jgi:hypothetical protein